ncbi:MFS transporter [Arthrobacter sp. AK01]|uniref:MFS transporter n=1 Tax=Arthrobacter sp. AK01 TaxID=2894084 RepID=UPI001E2D0000|nr:MFS transporter [Arthrobacter sp. AK01]MCD4852640.1 MFS transporter [Arthrobacter sp. AK01]
MRRRATIAGGVGTLIEYFDFAVYALVAVYIAPKFFPGENALVGLLFTLGIFASSYVVRPLGGWYFGRLGDREGRRKALIITIVTMGIATGLIGALPGYDVLGVGASILLLLLRMIQGFCAGGEISGAATYIAETAPAKRRGFYTSAMAMGSVGGFAAASFVCGFVAMILPADQMASWGWRIPFLIVVPLTLLCLYYRLKIEETPEFKALPKSHVARSPMREVLTKHPKKVLKVFLLVLVMTGTGNIANTYFATFLINNRGLGSSTVYWTIAIGTTVVVLSYPLVGILSDRLGRKRVIMTGYALFILVAFPVFLTLDNSTNMVMIGVAFVIFMLVHALTTVPGYILYAEIMPRNVRYTGQALGMNLALVLTGVAPLFVAQIVGVTGTITVLTWWVLGLMAIGFATISTVKETAHDPLLEEAVPVTK